MTRAGTITQREAVVNKINELVSLDANADVASLQTEAADLDALING